MRGDDLIRLIDNALIALYRKDKTLIDELRPIQSDQRYTYVGELSICFRFGYYLQTYIYMSAKEQDANPDSCRACDYNLDAEYCRDMYRPKYDRDGNINRPDFVLHKRRDNSPGANLLAIEVKPWWNIGRAELTEDVRKVKDIWINQYKYEFGLVLVLGRTIETVEKYWYHRGDNDVAEPWPEGSTYISRQ